MKRYARFESRDPHPEVPFEEDKVELPWLPAFVAAAMLIVSLTLWVMI